MAGKDYVSPGFLHASMGMVTESAENLDLIKKGIGYGRPADLKKIKDEMGDLHYYWTLACVEAGLDLRKIMESNMSKLEARFADGYTDDEANNRDLKKEHEAINKENPHE